MAKPTKPVGAATWRYPDLNGNVAFGVTGILEGKPESVAHIIREWANAIDSLSSYEPVELRWPTNS